ncbi:MAG TPA: aquaporin, partial [Candidatus Rubrimentiphilum sp.]|nr:aquaporin [Candidatus Rubrimentiphilum sp.]
MADHRQKKPALPQKLAAELIGTFFATLVPTSVDILYYTGSHVDFVSRWLARGFIATAMIYAFSEISGAHIDPAVSLGFAIRRTLGFGQMLLYWLVQFGGAFGASLLAWGLWGSRMVLGASHPGLKFTQLEAVLAEIVLTFLLMTVILATAEENAVVGKQSALAVGLTIATCGFFAGEISGASMNPARSIAPQIVGGAYNIIWIYALGPCIGAALAALPARFIFGKPREGEIK